MRVLLNIQTAPDPCYEHQCQNGALCVSAEHNYTCQCPQEYSGPFCQLKKVHGGWGQWTEWTQCSGTCGGRQQRQRSCSNPAPTNDGNDCSGPLMQTQPCGPADCKVDGEWSPWGEWSDCSAACGGGETNRSRDCDSPAPQHGGADCEGSDAETMICGDSPCPEHGGWADWSPWSPCSVTCAGGMQSRERSCDNPPPSNGGQACKGLSNQTKECNDETCPVCSELLEAKGTIFNCTETADPELRTCVMECQPGYSSTIVSTLSCGQLTGYLWDFERPGLEGNGSVPHCTPIMTPTTVASSTTVPLPKASCDLKDRVSDQVTRNMEQLPCFGQELCHLKVHTECNRTSPSDPGNLVVTTELTADLGESFSLMDSDNETVMRFVEIIMSVDRTAAMIAINDTQDLFTVTVDNVTFIPDVSETSYTADAGCPPGASLSRNGGCVECRPGFYEEGGRCVLCPEGQYQDLPASTSCTPCPQGTFWDSPGASSVDQCVYSNPEEEPNTTQPTEDTASDASTVYVNIASALFLISAAFAIFKVIRFKQN